MTKLKFGTDGWRAVMCDEFTFANVRAVVQGIADFVNGEGLQDRGIVVGYDTRFLAEKFAEQAVEVLAGNGIKVLLVKEAAPTPVTAFAIKHWQTGGAVMFTASHNPPEYNGIKFIPEYAGPATPVITGQLEKNISAVLDGRAIQGLEAAQAQEQGLVNVIDPRPPYQEHLKNLVDFDLIGQSKLKVVVDPMYGAGIGYVSNMLRECGCEVIAIHEHRDPLFGGSLPEPTAHELTELIKLVGQHQANLGLANDGDADRFGVIDADGTYITPNQVIALLFLHLNKNRGFNGGIARSVATTHLLDAMAKKLGVEVDETPVGFKYIGEKMLTRDILIGGEESGGLSIKGHIPEKDGILANLLMVEVVAKEKKTLSEVLKEVAAEFGVYANKRLDIKIAEDKKTNLIAGLKENPPTTVGKREVMERLTIDGVKFLLADGSWVLFRPSGTEPLMRVYLEALSPEDLIELEQDVRKLIDLP
ncbi:MAG: phosphoglucomutase/phosphomannomutase family protein [Clostridia bacterium]|nr:phosphoglucomutase/phosphomannomutase family protein [Clostridia bacterium]